MIRIRPSLLFLLLILSFIDSGPIIAQEFKSSLLPKPQLDDEGVPLLQDLENRMSSDVSVRIEDFGLYRFEGILLTEDVTQATGSRQEGHHVLIQTTDRIPAKLGVIFGIGFVVDAPANIREVTFRRITRFPPPGLTNPKTGRTHLFNESLRTYQVGQKLHATYGFDEEWEIVPGTWRIELWDSEHKAAEKAFFVTRP
jgi:hypothetical protein